MARCASTTWTIYAGNAKEVGSRLVADRIPRSLGRLHAVQRLMVASTNSNLSAVVDRVPLGISLENIRVPPAAE